MSATWTPTVNTLATSRTGCGRVTLTNGDVLVIGGWTKPASTVILLSSCELLDRNTQTWSIVGSLATARTGPSVILLNDGTVLCAGGQDVPGNAIASCEVYDPIAQTWSTVGPMAQARYFGGMYLLSNGTVLNAGGAATTSSNRSTCEIYDPVAKTWSATGSLPFALKQPYFGMLGDGRPIFSAWIGTPSEAMHTLTFNGSTWDTQPAFPVLSVNDDNNCSAVLPNGNFIVVCPLSTSGMAPALPNSYIFDIGSNTWSTHPAPSTPHNSVLYTLSNGKILLPGGMLQVDPNINTALCDIYDPNTDTWTSTVPLPATGILSASAGEVKGALLDFTDPVWVGIQHDGGVFSDNAAYIFSLQTSQGATMSNMQTTPFVDSRTVVPVLTAGSGTFVYNMQGIGRASLQLNTTFSNAGDTDVVTLKISNDGVNFVGFSTAKTVTFTGGTTDSALFELGNIDYVFLQVSWAAPSAHTFSMQGVMYGVDGRSAF